MRYKGNNSVSELMGRSCCSVHFINAIMGDAIVKKLNVNGYGKRSLLFKTVKDILEQDAGAIVKKQSIGLPVVDRSLRELEMGGKEHDCLDADNEIGGNSGEDCDGEMTLKQLKQKCKTNKRKRVNSVSTCTELVCVKLEPVEEDPDLEKPIISLKSKLPKAKRKRVQAVAKSLEVGISSNPEKDLDNEMQHHLDLTGVPEPDVAPLLDHPQVINLKDTTATEEIPNQTLETIDSGNATPLSFSEGYGSCVLHQISYDHSDNVEPSSQIITSEQTTDPSYVEKSCQNLQDYLTSEFETQDYIDLSKESESPTKNQISEINEGSSSYVSSHGLVEMSCNSSPVTEVPSLIAEDCTNSKEFYHGCDSWLLENNVKENISPEQQLKDSTSPTSGLSSSENHFPCSGTDENLFSSQGPTTSASNCLDTASSLVLPMEECSLNEQADNSVGEERNSSPNSTDNEHASAHVSAPPPERLLLTRKVLSPSSQERISLAMNSKETHDEIDRKANTALVKKGGDEASPVADTPRGSGSVKQTRGTTSPSILKKLKNGKRRNSLPKGNLEGPRLSRSLQNFSTGCTSLQKCSESAIAFSKRQMQDIEALAMNLMGELKSMKDVMEGKFLSDVRQTSDLKREAEEVKEAVTHASRTEETTRRWLSMMSRDSTRFCKIMSMKQSGSANADNTDTDFDATNNNVAQTEREGKKIAFADEAGGRLCHVKYFENDMKLKTDIKQEDETQ